jgi:ABC-type nitrate/sulfonate/bicarbonate transport system permease component
VPGQEGRSPLVPLMADSVQPKTVDAGRYATRASTGHVLARSISVARGLRVRTVGTRLLGILAPLIVWEFLTRGGVLPREYLPPTSVIIAKMWDLLGQQAFWSDVGLTLEGWAIGFGISIAVALPLGLIVGTNAYLYRGCRIFVEAMRPIPSVALIPLAVLIFGISTEMKVFLVAFATFWPIFIQSIYGVQDVDPIARDTARSFGLGRRAIFFRVTLPSAAPYIATGLRLANALAIILAITAELVAGVPGLGRSILLAQSGGTNDLLYALIAATGLLSFALSAAFSRAERRLLHWHTNYRAGGKS